MNNLKKILMISVFAFLAACGNESDKFVGIWADPRPAPEEGKGIHKSLIQNQRPDTEIKAVGKNRVEVKTIVLDRPMKHIYEVEGANIHDGSRVRYTLEGDELVTSSGLRLVRK